MERTHSAWGSVRALINPLGLVGAALLILSMVTSSSADQFGVRCQKTYENGWASRLYFAWSRCGGFNAELDDTDTEKFYYNLVGSTCGFSSCDGSPSAGGVDAVDLFYVHTHGGADSDKAELAMWDDGVRLNSTDWRYGDDNDQVAIFSQYACETMENTDGRIWQRWGSAFKGGVYIVTGSHEDVFASIATDEVGRDYADGLQKGKSVRAAWFDGNSDWFHNQDLAVMAVGSSVANCSNRRDGIEWGNYSSYSRLRDSDINYWCRVWITG